MVLFKQVKKPVIKSTSAGADVSLLRPSYVLRTPPCTAKCPLGNDVRGWVVPLAQHEAYGRTPIEAFELAWRQITERNPFPAVCGRVCQHPCEASCNRKEKDGALSVNLLERFVGDFGVAHNLQLTTAAESARQSAKVAIVGAGPAGLSCAFRLARLGYAVTLFEAAPVAGGMMRYRIPRTLVPSDVLDFEIRNILHLGVECRTGCVVGQDVSIAQIKQDFQAVFFAIGLQKPAQLELRVESAGIVCAGELPSEAPEIPAEAVATDPRVINSVSLAIGQGITVAEAIDCHLRNQPATKKAEAAVIKSDRMKLDWYAAAPRPAANSGNGEVLSTSLSEADAIAEAKRCLSCGLCMDCETCWMYCSNNCFEKLPKGEHYKLKLDVCNGCKKCAEACPCGYIEMN